METQIYDSIIIGAGMTGLSCAQKLAQSGQKILILEKLDTLGGLLSSFTFDTFSIERFYHHFFRYDEALIEMIDLLGLTENVVWKKASTGYYYQGEIYNLDTPREIFLYRHLSFRDKIKLGFAVLKIKRMKNFKHLDSVTATEWLLKNTGHSVYHNFFAPLLKSKFGTASDQISAAWLCARLKLRSNRGTQGEELGYIREGFELFIHKLGEHLKQNNSVIQTGEAVRGIAKGEDSLFTVTTEHGNYRSRSVVSTVAPYYLKEWFAFSDEYRRKLDVNKSQSVVCAILGMKERLLPTYWLNIRSESLPFALLIEHTNFHDIPEYKGQKILYVAAYQDGPDDTLYAKSEDDIIALFIDGLIREFNMKEDAVLWHRLSKASAVGPIYTIHFLDNQLDNESEIPGLFIGGMMTSYPERGISASIEQGKICSQKAIRYLRS